MAKVRVRMGFDPKKRPAKLSVTVHPDWFSSPRIFRIMQVSQVEREVRAFLRELRKHTK